MSRVLVVDDDPDIRAIVVKTLNQNGFQTTVAANAADALAYLATNVCDLVMTDIHMDGMGGLSLTKTIREQHPHIPSIVMTGHASMESAISAIRSGACDYLVKPFENLESINSTVCRALETAQAGRAREAVIDSLTDTNKKLRHLATRDGLTDLYNHRYILELLTAEFERASRYRRNLSLLFIDVDHFKEYNDRNGHPQGDKVLRRIADILQETTRKSDAVGRWGGEEFVVITPETTLEAAEN